MDSYQYLIIGGGIAGITAAETIREQDPNATICVISHEAYPLYSRVLLPSYLKRKIPREKLFLRTIDNFIESRIELRLQETVTAVDEKRREVTLSRFVPLRKGSGEAKHNGATLGYGKLLIASGGHVKPWGRPEDESVMYRLQTLDDADRLFSSLATIKNPLVIGSSFISLEFLEIFLANNIAPGLLMRDEHFFAPYLEEAGGELMRAHFQRHHIALYERDEIAKIQRDQNGVTILTKAQQIIPCDTLAVAIGIERNFEFLRASNVLTGDTGIRVNEFFETNQENVYAAGDVAELLDPRTRNYHATGNWTSAFLQGKAAGSSMSGLRKSFAHVPSYSITNLGLQITMVGDCTNASDTIVRVSMGTNEYERLFLVDGAIHGAVLINRFKDKAHIVRLIETQQKIDAYRNKLASFQFDITAIPAV